MIDDDREPRGDQFVFLEEQRIGRGRGLVRYFASQANDPWHRGDGICRDRARDLQRGDQLGVLGGLLDVRRYRGNRWRNARNREAIQIHRTSRQTDTQNCRYQNSHSVIPIRSSPEQSARSSRVAPEVKLRWRTAHYRNLILDGPPNVTQDRSVMTPPEIVLFLWGRQDCTLW